MRIAPPLASGAACAKRKRIDYGERDLTIEKISESTKDDVLDLFKAADRRPTKIDWILTAMVKGR